MKIVKSFVPFRCVSCKFGILPSNQYKIIANSNEYLLVHPVAILSKQPLCSEFPKKNYGELVHLDYNTTTVLTVRLSIVFIRTNKLTDQSINRNTARARYVQIPKRAYEAKNPTRSFIQNTYVFELCRAARQNQHSLFWCGAIKKLPFFSFFFTLVFLFH